MSMATRKLFAAGALVERESSCDGGCVIENPFGRGEGDFVAPRSIIICPLLVLLFLAGAGVAVFDDFSTVSVSSELLALALVNAPGKIWAKHKSEIRIPHRHIIGLL